MEDPPDAMSANVVRLEELGHGATGCVYKAVHATSLQLLAVKEVGALVIVELCGAFVVHVVAAGGIRLCSRFFFCVCACSVFR